jgi:subtilisin family serine protease
MKTSLTIFLLLLCTSIAFSTEVNQSAYDLAMEMQHKQGEVIVKFHDDIVLNFSKSNGIMTTGLTELDTRMQHWEVNESRQVFRGAQRRSEVKINRFPDGTEKPVPQLHNIFVLTFPETYDPEEVVRDLETIKEIEYAEVIGVAFITDLVPESPLLNEDDLQALTENRSGGITPNDPIYSQQWYLPHVNAPQVWETTTGDTDIVIAILDTGVDWTHPDLQNKIWSNPGEVENGQDSNGNSFIDDIRGWDFVNNNNNPMDDNGHGTHCAGIAAAETDNGIGIAGVSWGAKIMPIKVFQSNGTGYYDQIAEGIWYAAMNGARISSNSWGGYTESITTRLAFEYAYSKGPIIAAAGNQDFKIDYPYPPWPPTHPLFPASYNWIIGVEATSPNGFNAWFSNFDPTGPVISDSRPYDWIFFNDRDFNYEVRAPGTGILSTVPNGQYRVYNGTSMATPIVAGAISLMLSHEPDLSNEQLFAKLIQPVKLDLFTTGVLDIEESMFAEPPPDLYFVSYEVVDTINGGNNNGLIDAGETIELFITAKNVGFLAEDVRAKIRFAEFEDQTTANIIQNTCHIGSISAYGTGKSQDAIILEIDENVAHGRIISFELLLWNQGTTEEDTVYTDLALRVFKGIEIAGSYAGLLHLEDDGYYVVTAPAVIDSLIIEPGLTLRFANHSFLMINHYIYAVGEPYEMITFKGDVGSYVKGITMSDDAESTFKYCIFQDGYGTYGDQPYLVNPQTVHHSIFRYNHYKRPFEGYFDINIKYNLIHENYYHGYGEHNLIMYRGGDEFKYNILANNIDDVSTGSALKFYRGSQNNLDVFIDNVFLNNQNFSVGTSSWNAWPMGIYFLPEQYWGGTDYNYVKNQILDFYDFGDRAVLEPDSILEKPPAEAHGVVWKVLINGENPMDGNLQPLGAGPAEFEVHFNRPMDIAHDPFVTFGVRYPFTQNMIADNASWSADSTMWSASYTMELNTGDGINTLRVAHARDTEGFEIPIERGRFDFSVQVAGSQAVDFFATPGIGIVSLTWPEAESAEVLGYNMYRFEMQDTLATDTLLINNVLITDNFFTDYNVIPDSTYYYMFTMLGTDFVESDFSKVVFAKPFNAATGDANGDYKVDVLDIVTIVSYMLGHNPQPFIFGAADVNQDGVINVMDIVGVVNIIMNKTHQLSPVVSTHPDQAYVHLKDQVIVIESVGQLAAIQFELHTAFPENVQLSSLQPGFELAWTKTGNGIFGILFNLQNKCLPEGIHNIIHIQHQNPDLSWGEIFGADPDGQIVEILTEPVGISEQQYLPNELQLDVFPNPARELINIEYSLPMAADVEVVFLDILGRRVGSVSFPAQQPGLSTHAISIRSQNLPEGIVFCRVTARGHQGGLLQKTVKVVVQ